MSKQHTHHIFKDEKEQGSADFSEEAREIPAEGANLGGNPDAGAEKSGLSNDNVDAELAQNQPSQEERIAELEEQLAESKDQLLRKAAEFENFRKRLNQEKQSAIEFANQSLLLDIIPVMDDFDRAIQSAEQSMDFAGFLNGITMIEKQLTGRLESKWGLKRFNSAGEPFDPNQHEALMMEKSPDVTEVMVKEDLIKGYFLKDRLIRAAKVKVLMPEKPDETEPKNP